MDQEILKSLKKCKKSWNLSELGVLHDALHLSAQFPKVTCDPVVHIVGDLNWKVKTWDIYVTNWTGGEYKWKHKKANIKLIVFVAEHTY